MGPGGDSGKILKVEPIKLVGVDKGEYDREESRMTKASGLSS